MISQDLSERLRVANRFMRKAKLSGIRFLFDEGELHVAKYSRCVPVRRISVLQLGFSRHLLVDALSSFILNGIALRKTFLVARGISPELMVEAAKYGILGDENMANKIFGV